MKFIDVATIKQLLDIDQTVNVVRTAFIQHASNKLICPNPLQMVFNDADGQLIADCHVKAAYPNIPNSAQPYFVIKIASGFYQNANKNLPVNDGMVLLQSAETGQPVVLFQDEGWLTAYRTAAAGVVAASLRNVDNDATLGIVGTGVQARLQSEWICHYLGLHNVVLYGRSSSKTYKLKCELESLGLTVTVAETCKELCYSCDIVVATTPSTEPVIMLDDVPDKLHIVALGADSPGKVEIDPMIFSRASEVVVDSYEQCLSHSDYGTAVRAEQIESDSVSVLGNVIENNENVMCQNGITLVDLTGLGVQDLAIATLMYDTLKSQA